MYNNIGGKIKSGAMVIAYIEGIISLICGCGFIIMDEDNVFMGVMIIVIGMVVAYLSSWLLYGYGELIESAADIRKAINSEGNTQAIKHDSKIAKTFEVQGVMNIPKRQSGVTTDEN